MTLHRKTLVLIGLTVIGLILAMQITASAILLRGFEWIEQQEIQENVQRAKQALDEELESLRTTARDYARWDDTYQFEENHNPDYLAINYSDPALFNITIDLIVIVDRHHQILYAQGYDPETGTRIPAPTNLPALFTDNGPLAKTLPEEGKTGILVLPEGTLLLSAQSIGPSLGNGEFHGQLLMGRFLNPDRLQHLGEITGLSLEAKPIDDPALPADFSTALTEISAQITTPTRVLSANRVAGYQLIYNLENRPALLLRVDTDRPIYRQGLSNAAYQITLTFALGLIFLIIIWFLLKRLVLERLSNLNNAVAAISSSNILTHRVPTRGQDELSNLGQAINDLLERLSQSQAEQLRTAATLQVSENRYRSLVEQIPAVIYIKAAPPSQQLNYISPQIEALTGYAPAEWIAHPDLWFNQIHPDDRAPFLTENYDNEGTPTAPVIREYRLLTRNGEIRWIRDEAVKITTTENGESTAFRRGIMIDITARKESEEKLRHYTAELQARNEELDAFSHMVAHDLKNPLARVIGFAELILYSDKPLPQAESQKYLQIVRQSGFKMKSIIEELMLLAGIRKITHLQLTRLDMARIFDDASQRINYLLEDSQMEINLPDDWPDALGHGPWVEEIWVNYLSNALKYGGKPPKIDIGAETQPDGKVRFWVHDNGPGLTPEQQSRLFTPFVRLNQIRAEGHGLGLSIVRRIVERLGGDARVESSGRPGEGSTFSFTLPQAPNDNRRN